ncbi:MAG: C4-dicarboxylate transport transcriptional regulatory protein DctD [bacterium ADurb.Bin363]|nr:MAG: C4-dicarboxylate transport transcriptional regulatory protein DctD [bacterium ADurb.Bin363]
MGNILIVDDEEDVTYALKRLLEEEGYNVKTAINCREVLSLLEKEYFDAVIVELFLREEDGFQVLETVQELDGELPFILMVDNENEHIAIQSLEMGAYDYIGKPIIYTDIINTVYRAVEKRRLYVARVNAEEGLEVTSRKLNLLMSIIETFSSNEDEEKALDELLQIILNQFTATYCCLSILDKNGKNIKILAEKSSIEGVSEYKVGQSYALDIFPITTQAVETGEPVVESGIMDLTSPISLKLKEKKGGEIYCSFMEIPVMYFGKPIGVLQIKSHGAEKRSFTDNDFHMAETLANYIGIAIDNVRLRKYKDNI